jgi:2-oxoglutarate dehydrogenase E2 component (dihydrolipoamide succinyltransferase)
MAEIKVPTLGESVTEATVSKWLKKPGDAVAMDEALVELETDKVTLEVNAQAAGVLGEVAVAEGDTVNVGALLGTITEGATAAAKPAAPAPAAAKAPEPAPAPAAPAPAAASPAAAPAGNAFGAADALAASGPAARKLVADNKLDPAAIPATGKDGRITKGDVLAAAASPAPAAVPAPKPAVPAQPSGPRPRAEREERVKMTRLRQRIAERLKEAQNTAAMLTTFNEVDMSQVMAIRAAYKDTFEKKHGVKLGFMSFFVKAAIAALKDFLGQCRDRRRRHRLQELLRYRRGGLDPDRAHRAGDPRRRSQGLCRDREDHRRSGRSRPRRQVGDRRAAGRHLHHYQWRHLRLADVDPDHQPAAIGHPGHA